MPVSEIALREGLRAFGATKPTQVVIWENLMDAKTVLLTANTETVYAHQPSRTRKPTVRRWSRRRRTCWASCKTGCSGTFRTSDRWVRTRARAANFSCLPPGFQGSVPEGYFVSHSPTYSVTFAVRGFQVDGKTDEAVALMKQIKVYPLDKASSPPPMEFLNGSGKDINTVFPDNLPLLRTARPAGRRGTGSTTSGRWNAPMMQAIGIEKGKPFKPDEKMKAILSEAARLAGPWRVPIPTPRPSPACSTIRPQVAGHPGAA